MSTKHVRKAADLVRFGAGLRIEFASCSNPRTLDGFDVARTLRHEGVQEDPAAAQVLAVRGAGSNPNCAVTAAANG